MWPTGCEKTTWIIELLRYHEELCTLTPKKLIWIYGVEQPELFETIRKIWFPHQCEFVDGFPEDLLTRLEQTSNRGSLCIFDDVMNEVSSNSMVSKLFRRGRSHLGCFLVLMLQNIFPKGTQSRTISINAQYRVLFVIQETVYKSQSLLVNFIHTIVKTFSKFTKELHKDRMDTCFVVLFSLVQIKFVIAQTFFRMNIHPLCINHNLNI